MYINKETKNSVRKNREGYVYNETIKTILCLGVCGLGVCGQSKIIYGKPVVMNPETYYTK